MEEVGERVGENNHQYQAKNNGGASIGNTSSYEWEWTSVTIATLTLTLTLWNGCIVQLTSAGISGSLFGMGRGNEYTCAWGGCVRV